MSEKNEQEQKISKKERIVNHLKEHKTTYICAAAGAVAGAAVGVVAVSLRSPKMPEINVPIVNNNTPVFNNVNTNNMGGYSTKMVECVETGQIWKTVKDAAAAAGVDPAVMSKHLNGRQRDIFDLHYTIIGFGSTGN